ncbi:unnamed protein product [Heterobilharzia americana]|nr:unnamed protein product [Heterobilharzia americana]
MVERLGASRKGFPINYRHSSTTAYAGSLLKIRWIARKNKQQGALGTNQLRSYRSTNMQWKEVEMDWAYTEKADWGHHASGPRVESPWEATSWTSEGDMEEMVRGGNESL